MRDGNIQRMYALITTSPFFYQGGRLVLLVLEDINEIIELRKMIPICAKCKKVRLDKEYWVAVESYFRNLLDIDFSHGLCPDCYKEEIEAMEKAMEALHSSKSSS